jgi:hypothetical protein
MEDEPALEAFRLRYRVAILERLVLKTAFLAPLLSRRLSKEESRQMLIGWLNNNISAADQTFGEYFQDPALSALYADEVKDLVDKMIAIVEDLYRDAKDNF